MLLEADNHGEMGPTTYLDVYKKTFKIHASAKERLRVASELKASTRTSGTQALDKRVF